VQRDRGRRVTHTLFVPGRLCLLGEHSDWAGAYRATHPALPPGACLVSGTDQGLHAEAAPHDGVFEIATRLPGGARRGPRTVPLRPDALDAVARGAGFFSYAAGVAAEVLARYGAGGLRLEVTGADLPVGRGLSSSAAICVLVARAFNLVHDLGLSREDEMDLAWAGERRAGSACGRMDQVCAYGRRTLRLVIDGERLDVEPLAPGGRFAFLVVDLGGDKDTRRILADLHACFPDAPGRRAAGVREALGPRNTALVAAARAAVLAGDAPGLGALLDEAQVVFDRLVVPASAALDAPRLRRLRTHPALRELAWGTKGVGSQGDGAAQILARGVEERDHLAARLTADLGLACLPLTLDPASTVERRT
jgi:galactokinase